VVDQDASNHGTSEGELMPIPTGKQVDRMLQMGFKKVGGCLSLKRVACISYDSTNCWGVSGGSEGPRPNIDVFLDAIEKGESLDRFKGK